MDCRRAAGRRKGPLAVDATLRRILAITGLVLGALWLIAVLLGDPLPGWVAPCSVVAVAAAAVI